MPRDIHADSIDEAFEKLPDDLTDARDLTFNIKFDNTKVAIGFLEAIEKADLAISEVTTSFTVTGLERDDEKV